jgi:hypothetical protein
VDGERETGVDERSLTGRIFRRMDMDVLFDFFNCEGRRKAKYNYHGERSSEVENFGGSVVSHPAIPHRN